MTDKMIETPPQIAPIPIQKFCGNMEMSSESEAKVHVPAEKKSECIHVKNDSKLVKIQKPKATITTSASTADCHNKPDVPSEPENTAVKTMLATEAIASAMNKLVQIVKMPVQSCKWVNIEASRASAGSPNPLKVLFKPSVPIVPSA